MPTAYIICDNDATLHVVIGNDKDPTADDHYAEQVKKRIMDEERERCIKHYGVKDGPTYFKNHFFHLHRVTCEEAPDGKGPYHQPERESQAE